MSFDPEAPSLLTEDILKGRKLEELSTEELVRLDAKNRYVFMFMFMFASIEGKTLLVDAQ